MRFRTRFKEPGAADPDRAASDTSENGPRPRPAPRRGFRPAVSARLVRMRAADSPLLVNLGLLLIAGGFGLVAYTWGRVAGLLAVPLQLPFVVSGGFTGLGIVLVGIMSISIGTKRRDAWEREQRLRGLSSTLERIASALNGNSGAREDSEQRSR